MQCSKCRNESVIFQQYSGRYLCREHVIADIESRIKRDIRAGRWIRPGDHLAVALSPSKSSRALLFFLHKLTAKRRDVRLSAIVIDEGITGYSGSHQSGILSAALGIPYHSGEFRNEYKQTIDEFAKDNAPLSPCSRCRQLRYELIGTVAQQVGATRIISDRTLEDQAAGILEKILLGQVEMLVGETGIDNPVPWIYPLQSVPRAEADLYADALCPGDDDSRCPYWVTGFSEEIKDLLEDYSKRHPATPYSVFGIGKALCGNIRRSTMEESSHAA